MTSNPEARRNGSVDSQQVHSMQLRASFSIWDLIIFDFTSGILTPHGRKEDEGVRFKIRYIVKSDFQTERERMKERERKRETPDSLPRPKTG